MVEENKKIDKNAPEAFDPKRNKWFRDHEVFYIEKDKQRDVMLNPGFEKEIFRKTYPNGEFVLKKTYYLSELPPRRKGKIIAVTAVPVHKNLFRERYRNHKPYKELSTLKILKPKPIGNFYELFEDDMGWRIWVSPSEYQPIRKPKRDRQ